MPAAAHERNIDQSGSADRSVALIGPNETSRSIVARALAASGGAKVREFQAYPAHLSDLSRVLDQKFDMLIIDIDSDESYALAIVEKAVSFGGIVVMAYSRRSQPELIHRCMHAGVRDLLQLPGEPEPSVPAPAPVPVASPRPQPIAQVSAPVPAMAAQAASPIPAVPAPVPVVAAAPEPLPEQPPPMQSPPTPAPVLDEQEVPIFRYVGMAPPPSRRRLPRVLLVVVPLVALAGAGVAFFPQIRHALPRSAEMPRSAPPANSIASAPVPTATVAAPVDTATAAAPEAAPPAAHGARVEPVVSAPAMDSQLNAPTRISGDLKKPVQKNEPSAGFAPVGIDEGNTTAPGSAFASQHNVRVALPPAAISAGVAAGMLIHKTEPVYPEFARKNRIGGAVLLGATISKTGAIQNLHVISGPAMLREAALSAAHTWRYRPYMLDNQPVEVQTTISIVFNLSR